MVVHRTTDRAWIVLCVRGGRELAVAERMAEVAIEAYVPMGRRMVASRHCRKPRAVAMPAFGGYVFARGTAEMLAVLRAARPSASDIIGVVGRGGRAWTLGSAQVDDLRAREADGAFDRREAVVTMVRIGDRVTVYGGPATGLSGRVEDLIGAAAVIPVGTVRFRVALDMLALDVAGAAA